MNGIFGYSIDLRTTAALAVAARRIARSTQRGSSRTGASCRRGRSSSCCLRKASPGPWAVSAFGGNADVELFFTLLQKNILAKTVADTTGTASQITNRTALAHNHRRRERRLGRLTPIEFEMMEPAVNVA
jgi:putative transposase